jgi:hypothetical protein
MILIRHFNAETLPFYEGEMMYIQPGWLLILVPRFEQTPSLDACPLLTRTGVQSTEKTSLLTVYTLDNSTAEVLTLKPGDVMGAYYTGPHAEIKAERCQMLSSQYEQMLQDERDYWEEIYSVLDLIAEDANGEARHCSTPVISPTFDDETLANLTIE